MGKTRELSTFMEGFRLYCLAEGKRSTTIRWYMGKLAIFERYLLRNGFPTDVTAITVNHLRAFLAHLRDEVAADENNPHKPTRDVGLSPLTIQGHGRTLKAFFSWLTREGYLGENPTERLKIPKAPKVIVETLTEAQIHKFLSVIDSKSGEGFRDYCIALVLLDTGIRLSELVHLTLMNLNLEQACFKVMGKGAKERIVPIGANVQKALWKYIHQHRPEPIHPNVTNLFLRRDGQALKPDGAYRMVRKYGEKAGLKGVRCSPHTFRHTFAKNFLLNGGDVFTLQKILGHSSLEVVKMYVQLASEDVQIQHRRHSPVDRMKLRL
jgi:site-specific recombinase XerD